MKRRVSNIRYRGDMSGVLDQSAEAEPVPVFVQILDSKDNIPANLLRRHGHLILHNLDMLVKLVDRDIQTGFFVATVIADSAHDIGAPHLQCVGHVRCAAEHIDKGMIVGTEHLLRDLSLTIHVACHFDMAGLARDNVCQLRYADTVGQISGYSMTNVCVTWYWYSVAR